MENRSVIMGHMGRFYKKGFSLEEIREKIGEAIELWLEFMEGYVRPPEAPRLNETVRKVEAPYVDFEGFEKIDCMYYIPDNAPMRKSKKRYKGYIPGGL